MVSQHAELIENDYFILFGELNVLSRLVLSQYQMCSHTYTHRDGFSGKILTFY